MSQRTNLAEMDERFVDMLRGSTNSLGRTEEVVELVLADRDRVDEVYDLFFQPDEWVRMRAASVSKRLWRADGELFGPFVARWVEEVSQIDQASTQWTFANMCDECDDLLTNDERERSIEILYGYLANGTDWIVLNSSMPPLAKWALDRPELAKRVRPHLERLANDERKSVANRAKKAIAKLQNQ